MTGRDRPEPLSPLADFGDDADEATEELVVNALGELRPVVLPDYDDDPATESIEQHPDVGLPAAYQILRALAPEGERERFEVLHGPSGRVLVLEVASAPHSEPFDTWAARRSRLTQPGVLQVYEIGTLADGRAFLTHSRPEGLTLAEWSRGATAAGLVAVGISVGRTLGAAHAIGLAHGALAAGSIRMSASGQAILVDWSEGTPRDDVASLAAVLQQALQDRVPPRLAVVLQRARGGTFYADGAAFADALVDILQVR